MDKLSKEQRRRRRKAKEKDKCNSSGEGRQERLKPWVAPKMKLFKLPNLVKDNVPLGKRLELLREIGRVSQTKFDELYPQTAKWVTEYDPVYVLSMCAAYFISHPEGIDQEVTGKLDFYHHYLELLQAFALCQPRSHEPSPLLGEMDALKKHMQEVGQYMSIRHFDMPSQVTTEEDVSAYRLRTEMMHQTTAVRNWAYPHQFRRVLADLSSAIKQDFQEAYGINPVRFFDSLFLLAIECEEKLNDHIAKVRSFGRMRNYRDIVSAYNAAFPGTEPIEDDDVELVWKWSGRNRMGLISMLMTHSDLRLEDIYKFSLDHAHELIGNDADKGALRALLSRISYSFGDLASYNKEHFILTNPVLSRPFIILDEDEYFSAVWGVLPHVTLDILEDLVWSNDRLRDKYTKAKAKYLEDELERIVRDGFPHGQVLRGSLWKDLSGKEFENDLTVVIDTFAVVFEAKSASVSDPARRGAPERLMGTLRDLIEAPSTQAVRFIEFLKANPAIQHLKTKRGEVNIIDSRVIKYYIPIGITLSQLGSIGSNLKKLIAAGIVSKKLEELAPSINLTDLESIFELLPFEIEKVHYLARRREFEAHVEYEGDELDLLGFYLDNGFNIGEVEYERNTLLNLGLKSKELDPYFVGSREGKSVNKPHLNMTRWWSDIIHRVSARRFHGWLETGFILLNTTKEDQKRFELAFNNLAKKVRRGKTPDQHNWVCWESGPERRLYIVIGYPYVTRNKELRDSVLSEAVDGPQTQRARGVVALGVNVLTPHFPYDVLAHRASTNLFDTLTLTPSP